MSHDPRISHDPGTILYSFADVPAVLDAARPVAAVAVPPVIGPQFEELAYRSPFRIRTPRLTICDDGSLTMGELVYVRAEQVVIGRAKGDIRIPHDTALSGCHAEISRLDVGGQLDWVLRDLGSSNGTLARCRSVTLRPGMTLLIGSRRYRFDPGDGSAAADTGAASTRLLERRAAGPDALPALLETTPADGQPPRRLPFRATRFTIGRPGAGNAIELDDLCVAGCHASVAQDPGGTWHVKAEPSLNGVWVRIDAVRLIDGCLFQCGEQRFRFHA